jgi:hypothetical protein
MRIASEITVLPERDGSKQEGTGYVSNEHVENYCGHRTVELNECG